MKNKSVTVSLFLFVLSLVGFMACSHDLPPSISITQSVTNPTETVTINTPNSSEFPPTPASAVNNISPNQPITTSTTTSRIKEPIESPDSPSVFTSQPTVPTGEFAIPISVETKETLIGTIPGNIEKPDFLFSSDYKQVAAIIKPNDKNEMYMWWNGQEGKYYMYIEDVKFCTDGRNLAYSAFDGQKWLIVFNNLEQPVNEGFVEDLWLSPDGNRLAYLVSNGQFWWMVVGGQPGHRYDQIMFQGFSSDSQHFAYLAAAEDSWYLVTDTTISEKWDFIRDVQYSPVRKQYSFIATRGDFYYAVIFGQTSQPYERVHQLVISPDGTRFAFQGELNGNWHVNIDGDDGPAYEELSYGMAPVFSPDSRKIAYPVKYSNKWQVMIDRLASGLLFAAEPRQISFSPDSIHITYQTKILENAEGPYLPVALLDNVIGKSYNEIYGLEFTPDSTRIAYISTSDYYEPRKLVVDSVEYAALPEVNEFWFSPDSRLLAFTYSDENKVAVNQTALGYSTLSQITFTSARELFFVTKKSETSTGNTQIYLVECSIHLQEASK